MRYSVITLFAAGAIGVLLFHQGAYTVLHLLGVVGEPFPREPTWPFGVPVIWSIVFWGGLWGIVLGIAEARFPEGGMYWLTAFAFGALLPTLIGWFIVAPLKGDPIAGGWELERIWIGPLLNGVWGLGTALLLLWRR